MSSADVVMMQQQISRVEPMRTIAGRARSTETDSWVEVTVMRLQSSWRLTTLDGTATDVDDLSARVPELFTLSTAAADQAVHNRRQVREAKAKAVEDEKQARSLATKHFEARRIRVQQESGLSLARSPSWRRRSRSRLLSGTVRRTSERRPRRRVASDGAVYYAQAI